MFSCMYDDGLNDSLVKRPLQAVQPEDPMNKVLGYMGRTGLDAKKGAEILASALGTYSSRVKYPSSPIAQNMKAIAQIKLAEVGTRIFYTAHGSFDTHATQAGLHAQLLREIAEATAAFFADLREHQSSEDVVLLMFSEFGRRVSDNGGGTDHGAGNIAFVLGDKVKGGMYGEYPSLSEIGRAHV